MSRIKGLRGVFRTVLRGFNPEKEIAEEIRFHLETRVEDLVQSGMNPVEAEALAMKEFGDVERYEEELRSMQKKQAGRERRTEWWDALSQDLSFAIRQLWRNRGFTSVAVATLALGVGITTAIFSVVNGVLLRPLPYPDPDRLVSVRYQMESSGVVEQSLSQPDIHDLQDQAENLSYVTGFTQSDWTLTGLGESEIVYGARVTQGLLSTFGLAPALGRDLLAEENVPSGPAVVVIAHSFWQNRFGSDPDVIGKTVTLNDVSFEIVGVAPAGFGFPTGSEFWVPRHLNPEGCGRGCRFFRAVGRLEDATTLAAAREEVSAIAQRLEETYQESNHDRDFYLTSLGAAQVEGSRTALLALLASSAMVLLIACANVGNLLLVRGASRTSEIAVRSALGAGRGRVLASLLVENAALAILGGVLGLAMAYYGVQALLGLAPSSIPRLDEVSVDGTVLLFTTLVVAVVALGVGLIPGIRLARAPLSGTLRSGSRGTVGTRKGGGSRSVILTTEVALSLVLLLGTALLARSFSKLSTVNPGWEAEQLHRFTVSLPTARYTTPQSWIGFFDELENDLHGIPGVTAAGGILGAALSSTSVNADFVQTDRPEPPAGQESNAAWRVVTPGYFNAMNIPVIQGRVFNDSDRLGDQPVVVINESFAERFFPGEDPLGKPILPQLSIAIKEEEPRMVIGVVADARYSELSESPIPGYYVPQLQIAASFLTFQVRTQGLENPEPLFRDVVTNKDPNLPSQDVESMDAVLNQALGPARFTLLLTSIFTGLAVTLSAIGLYGVVAYSVSQRTREIAVRMALGAQEGEVVGLVFKQGLRPTILGIALGVVAAFAGTRLITALLYGTEPTDPISYVAAVGLLLTVSIVAATVPAIRAARVTPTVALNRDQ